MNLCKSNHMAYGNICYLISITTALSMNNPTTKINYVLKKQGQALDLDAIYFAVGGLVASGKITRLLHSCHSLWTYNMAFIG